MTYRIRVTGRARRDADAVVHWIANDGHSRAGAAEWLKAYQTALDSLTLWPESRSLAPEDECDSRELRQFFFKTRR